MMVATMVSCEVDPADTFSTDPAAPVLNSHSDILITDATIPESVTFTWTEAGYMGENLTYKLNAQYDGTDGVVTTSGSNSCSMTKSAFKAKLYELFTGLSVNDSFSMTFYVSVIGEDDVTYTSNSIIVKIYANGDFVAPVLTPVLSDITLTDENADSTMNILTWTAARMTYNEAVTYSLYILNKDSEDKSLIEGDLTENSYSMNQQSLNDAVVSAGYEDGISEAVSFEVIAIDESSESGLTSNIAGINITPYKVVYPDVLYLPGSHQGWDPASAPSINLSSKVDGQYETMVNIVNTDATATTCSFKFCEESGWGSDFGFADVILGIFPDGGIYNMVTGSTISGDNIEVPNGFYNVKISKKDGTLKMYEIVSLGAIGTAVGGWDKDYSTFTYDADSKIWTATIAFTEQGDWKIRANSDWTFAFGIEDGVVSSQGGIGNLSFSLDPGTYTVELNVDTCPYTITYTLLP